MREGTEAGSVLRGVVGSPEALANMQGSCKAGRSVGIVLHWLQRPRLSTPVSTIFVFGLPQVRSGWLSSEDTVPKDARELSLGTQNLRGTPERHSTGSRV